MKKLIVLVCAVVFLFGVIGIAQAHSNWAKYRKHDVPPGVNVPAKYIVDGKINCCGCHGRSPGLPELFCK